MQQSMEFVAEKSRISLQRPDFRSFILRKASQLVSGVRENASCVEAESGP